MAAATGIAAVRTAAELGAAHAKFVVYLSSLYAKVAIAKTEVTALGAGCVEVRGYRKGTEREERVEFRAVEVA